MVPPSASVMAGNGDVEHWNSASDSRIRHQNQTPSTPSTSREETNSTLFDAEIRELYLRTQSQEEEISQLHRRIADASTRELQLLEDKSILERKLSDLQMVVYEKQIDATSDAMRDLAQRKGILEDNLRMINDLKGVEEDIHIFTSSLLNLMAEFSIRPPVLNASTITSGVKRLYQHMNWKIRSSHGSNYNHYPHDSRLESTSNHLRLIQDHDKMDMKEVNVAASPDMHFRFTNDRQGQIGGTSILDDNTGEISRRKMTPDSQFNMPTIYEQPSLMSEGENSLPGIEGFQIIGEPRPGYTLRACGYPTNGTSLCIFQWFRHLQDGTREPIEGATVPDYVVTADDVDTCIYVDCIPMDEVGRQGKLVSCFANNQNKITCDPAMQHEIDSHISAGRAVFDVLMWRDSSDWVEVSLILKRTSYQIKDPHTDAVLIYEKYSPDLHIKVPHGLSAQFVVICSDGSSLPLTTDGISKPHMPENDIRLRDIIVLTMRSFKTKAIDGKRKGKM